MTPVWPAASQHQARRGLSARCAACLVGVVTLLVPSISGLTAAPVTRSAWLIGTHPIIPPPAAKLLPHLSQFWLLLGEYHSANLDARIPFGVWLVARGIVDPETHAAMMALYVWYLGTVQRSVHSAG